MNMFSPNGPASPTETENVRMRAVSVLKELSENKEKDNDEKGKNDELSRCLVYCRLRPDNKRDYEDDGFPLVSLNGNQVLLKDERHYDFDGTFGPSASQEEVFNSVAVPCIDHSLKGFRSALMCYGQTGTGKTYTMCNTDPSLEGIIPRASSYIFEKIKCDSSRSYKVVLQFVQIYRDHLGDLMTSDGKDRVEIHYDDNAGVSLLGCSSREVESPEAFMQFYEEGNARRVVKATTMNAESSRGHTAMIVWLVSENQDDPMQGKLTGKITFIDLAGYERFSKTGITNADPIGKDEAKTINASLLALGHVVSSLSSGTKHIPWRNSKLTRILQDSIGGRSRTSIILTVGPSSNHLYETTNSLQFGMRTMAVKVQEKLSLTVDYVKLSQKLMTLLEEKDQKISALELQIASRDADRQELLDQYVVDRNFLEEKFSKDLEQLTASGVSEEKISSLKELHRIEMENLLEQQNEEIGYQDEIHSKEISKLIQEQKHQEAKGLTAMKLAQEKLIEEFEQKLSEARGGTNGDLVQALRQISEKDAVMASRAGETASLQGYVKMLTDQIKDMGGVPAKCPSLPETFLDVTQVEDMMGRLNANLEKELSRVVELRTQLDRMNDLSAEHQKEIGNLHAVVEDLTQRLEKAGVAATESNQQLELLQLKRSEMIDASELETLRLSMQSTIDDLMDKNSELQAKIDEYNEEKVSNEKQIAILSRPRANSIRRASEIRSDDLPSSSNHHESEGRLAAMRTAYKKMMSSLTQQLSESKSNFEKLEEKYTGICELLSSNGIPLPSNLQYSKNTVAHENQGVYDTDVQQKGSGESLGNENDLLSLLIETKDTELEAQGKILEQQEIQLSKARSSLEHMSSVLLSMREALKEHSVDCDRFDVDSSPVDGISLEDYAGLLRLLRETNRKLTVEILKKDGKRQDGKEFYNEQIQERDQMLELKDELILEKGAMSQYMAQMSTRLIAQLEASGHTPCCRLPSCYEEINGVELNSAQDAKLKELEERLQKEQEEKDKMNRLLESFDNERKRQASVLMETETRNKELLERDSKATEAIHRLAEGKTQKEKVLEEAARRATRELMEMQAKLAEKEAERKATIFDRLFGR